MMVSVWRRLKIDYSKLMMLLCFQPDGAISLLESRQAVDSHYQRFMRSLDEGFGPGRPLSAAWKKFNQAHEDATQRRPERRDQDRM